MKRTLLAASVAAVLASTGSAGAATVEERLEAMEKRLIYLEKRVETQDQTIAEKDREISELKKSTAENRAGGESGGASWVDTIEIGGVIEVEASHTSADGEKDESDLITPTVELGITAQVNDWVGAELVLLYEEETDNDDGSGDGSDFSVDTAMITVADPNSSWFVNAGQYTLPFGTYNTDMIADPLTLDLGETGDTAIEAGWNFGMVTASVYTFQGDRDSRIDNFGAALNVEVVNDSFGFIGHLGYLNDLGESDFMVDEGFITDSDDVGAWIASAQFQFGAIRLTGEYLAAIDGFADASNDEPSAFNVEAAIDFDAMGKPATFALAYQGTDELDNIDDGISEKRIGGTIAVEVYKGTTLALEYRNDEDYTGADTDTITGLLAVEF